MTWLAPQARPGGAWQSPTCPSTTAGAWPAGMATAKGLLPNAGMLPPQGGRPILSSVLVATNPMALC